MERRSSGWGILSEGFLSKLELPAERGEEGGQFRERTVISRRDRRILWKEPLQADCDA